MSAHTITRTSWGEIRVVYGDEELSLRCICKGCGRITEQTIAITANPFIEAYPLHLPSCPIVRRRRGQEPAADVVAVDEPLTTQVSPASLQAVWIVGAAALVGLGMALGGWLW